MTNRDRVEGSETEIELPRKSWIRKVGKPGSRGDYERGCGARKMLCGQGGVKVTEKGGKRKGK